MLQYTPRSVDSLAVPGAKPLVLEDLVYPTARLFIDRRKGIQGISVEGTSFVKKRSFNKTWKMAMFHTSFCYF